MKSEINNIGSKFNGSSVIKNDTNEIVIIIS